MSVPFGSGRRTAHFPAVGEVHRALDGALPNPQQCLASFLGSDRLEGGLVRSGGFGGFEPGSQLGLEPLELLGPDGVAGPQGLEGRGVHVEPLLQRTHELRLPAGRGSHVAECRLGLGLRRLGIDDGFLLGRLPLPELTTELVELGEIGGDDFVPDVEHRLADRHLVHRVGSQHFQGGERGRVDEGTDRDVVHLQGQLGRQMRPWVSTTAAARAPSCLTAAATPASAASSARAVAPRWPRSDRAPRPQRSRRRS